MVICYISIGKTQLSILYPELRGRVLYALSPHFKEVLLLIPVKSVSAHENNRKFKSESTQNIHDKHLAQLEFMESLWE